MDTLITQLRAQIIEHLNLDDIQPSDVGADDPLFGDDGLGLDSIDALEVVVLLDEHYGIKVDDPNEINESFASLRTLAEFIKQNQSINATAVTE